jgi:hypothetical protein
VAKARSPIRKMVLRGFILGVSWLHLSKGV